MTRSEQDGPRGTSRGGAPDARDALEVVCDESGSDGENLTGGNTDVFTHASVALPITEAAAYLDEVHGRIRSPVTEYKANHLLRERHRDVLEWLLSPAGPLAGRASVHLVEKAYFVLDRTAGLLLDERAGAEALALHRYGRGELTGQDGRVWRDFLHAANRLLRVRVVGDAGGGEAADPVEGFLAAVAALRRACPEAPLLERLAAARPRADAYRARLEAGPPPLVPVLNPLPPAVVRTVVHWGAGGRPVRVVHDRQNLLTEPRIAWIARRAAESEAVLAGMELAQGRWEPRILLADFLAGIARRIASDELNGRADPELVALLRPFVAPASVWGDARSRATLFPGDGRPASALTDLPAERAS